MIRRVVADCSADVADIEGVDYRLVPLTISTDERSFVDDENLDVSEMLDYLSHYNGASHTACPGIEKWIECYEGADEVYVVTLSEGLSGTYNSAVTAGALYMEEHPEAKVHVFDSLSAGPEVRMLSDRIAEWVRAGLGYDEIISRGDEYIKHSRIFFALESFHNFAANGRVSKVVAAAAGLLGIRVLATGNPEGQIIIAAKCRGEAGTLKAFIKNLEEAGYEGGRVYIAHCLNSGFAQRIKQTILDKYEQAQILIYETKGLCSFYAEKGGILLACECAKTTPKVYPVG